ncbi:MAG TPA: magnesium transporter CorA family protein [Spirochaetota bacterium]|nr:magnesium transporter CorA family protein [Spirochaetota bacterium]HOL58008.1 magnesium transporter CorA family protein [Spirochaetota bacterium]HPP04580.1 magnesium transporter CorA family protein [Spirochaetota bacterium]
MKKELKIIEGKLIPCDNEEESIVTIFISPTKEECQRLIEEYHIDEHTLNSSLDPDEISRLEFEENHIAMIIKRPKNYSTKDNFLFKVTSIGLFIFKNKMIIVMPEDIQILERKFEGKPNLKINNLNDILLKLLYGTIYHFLGHLRVINMISDSIEEKINTSMENKYLINMFTLEKSLVYYLNGITSNGVLLEKIKTNINKFHFTEQQIETLEDVIIENTQCHKQAEIYSNILAGLMDARFSIVNNNLNILIKSLTILSVVFMPLNVIAGIGGMSEFSMMTQGIDWRISYSLLILGLIGVAFLTYFILRIFFKKK